MQQKARKNRPEKHADGATTRRETPELEGRTPLPEEVTGQASATGEDLVTLFKKKGKRHLADGFRGGSDDESLPD